MAIMVTDRFSQSSADTEAKSLAVASCDPADQQASNVPENSSPAAAESLSDQRFPIQAILTLPGGISVQRYAVRIIGETRGRYRIMADGPIRLPRKWLMPGVSASVPKHVVTLGTVAG